MEIGLLGLLIIIALATYFKKSFESDTVDYGKKISELEKEISRKMERSVNLQRNGKIKEYALATKEISELQDKLDAVRREG